MDDSISNHMRQLRTLREAAAEVGSSHPVLMRRIGDGTIQSWRVGGVVLVRIDQVRQAVEKPKPVASGSFREVLSAYPHLNVRGSGTPPGELGLFDAVDARAQLECGENEVAAARDWLLKYMRPIKAFSAQISAGELAALANVDVPDQAIQPGHMLAAALMGRYTVFSRRGWIPFNPWVAVSAKLYHAAQLRQIQEIAAARAPRKWAPGEFLGLS